MKYALISILSPLIGLLIAYLVWADYCTIAMFAGTLYSVTVAYLVDVPNQFKGVIVALPVIIFASMLINENNLDAANGMLVVGIIAILGLSKK